MEKHSLVLVKKKIDSSAVNGSNKQCAFCRSTQKIQPKHRAAKTPPALEILDKQKEKINAEMYKHSKVLVPSVTGI